MCFIYAFFVLQLLNSQSLISPQCLSASSFSSPFHLEHWHPLPLSLCFTGGGGLSLPPAPAITQNLLFYCSFWFLPDVPHPDLHLPPILFPIYEVALCCPLVSSLVSLFHSSTLVHVTPAVPVFLMTVSLVWRLIIIISHPHIIFTFKTSYIYLLSLALCHPPSLDFHVCMFLCIFL